MPAPIDKTGQRFGRLVVIKEAEPLGHPRKWVCLCDCGKTTEKVIKPNSTKSCGCLSKNYDGNRTRTHGESKSKLYAIWTSIKSRCHNPADKGYKFYGALGITVCDEWQQYEPFATWAKNNGYCVELSIDRIKGSEGYSPENCRWETKTTQARNQKKRCTNSSGFTGVSYHKKNRNWRACVHINYKSVSIGSYATREEAVRARDAYLDANNLEHYPRQI